MLDLKGDPDEAIPWLDRLNALVPADVSILSKLGSAHAKLGAAGEAARCREEAHRAAPANIGALSTLIDSLVEDKVRPTPSDSPSLTSFSRNQSMSRTERLSR